MKGFISGRAFPISSGHMDASASVPFFGNMALIFWRDEHVETEAKQDRTSIDVFSQSSLKSIVGRRFQQA
jgi:hypothetical protein